jgi:PP-loop superfamily ATP-utilizing enzyme
MNLVDRNLQDAQKFNLQHEFVQLVTTVLSFMEDNNCFFCIAMDMVQGRHCLSTLSIWPQVEL